MTTTWTWSLVIAKRRLLLSKLMKKPMKRCTGQPNVTSQWCTFAATVSFWFHLPAEVQINFTKQNDSSIHCKIKRNASLQLNIIHQTDLLFWYLNHHLTRHCSSVHEDLHRYARKIVFVIVSCLKITKICANLHKPRNNVMSNDDLIKENMDLSHIHLAAHSIT